jgi:hypothetical protein
LWLAFDTSTAWCGPLSDGRRVTAPALTQPRRIRRNDGAAPRRVAGLRGRSTGPMTSQEPLTGFRYLAAAAFTSGHRGNYNR